HPIPRYRCLDQGTRHAMVSIRVSSRSLHLGILLFDPGSLPFSPSYLVDLSGSGLYLRSHSPPAFCDASVYFFPLVRAKLLPSGLGLSAQDL
ncbi:mCG144752, partial [Mus musculus]